MLPTPVPGKDVRWQVLTHGCSLLVFLQLYLISFLTILITDPSDIFRCHWINANQK